MGSPVLSDDQRGERLDRAVARVLGTSVREARRAIEAREVLISGRPRAPGERVVGGETIDVVDFVARSNAIIVPDIELAKRVTVLYEDARIVALNKPSGIHTIPLQSKDSGTLLHAAVAIDPRIAHAGPPLEGGLVHRLDHGTSGVVVFARTAEARAELREAFARHALVKTYRALVLETKPVVVGTALRWSLSSRGERVVVDKSGLEAESVVTGRWPVGLDFPSSCAIVEVTTRTGRRHQIRVHLATLGAPIVGDPLYGPAEPPGSRLWLHAFRIDGPVLPVAIEAPPPAELVRPPETGNKRALSRGRKIS